MLAARSSRRLRSMSNCSLCIRRCSCTAELTRENSGDSCCCAVSLCAREPLLRTRVGWLLFALRLAPANNLCAPADAVCSHLAATECAVRAAVTLAAPAAAARAAAARASLARASTTRTLRDSHCALAATWSAPPASRTARARAARATTAAVAAARRTSLLATLCPGATAGRDHNDHSDQP